MQDEPKATGFVDIQNNGWKGVSFTDPDLTVEAVRGITRDLVSRGTVAYCPTVITAHPDVYRHCLPVLAEAMRDPEWGGRLLGIHLEGPFISPEPGAVGAHPSEFVLPPDPGLFDRFQEWAQGRIRLLTVAPGIPGSEALIRHAADAGVAVSMGHHMADAADMRRATDAGATLCTHLGNGLPNEIHRHRNPLWWQLASDRLTALFITDGHHLPADFIKVALRAKTAARSIVTSDASPLAGLPPGRYRMLGRLPVVIRENGLIYSEASRSLAGSNSTLMECMNHLASLHLLAEPELRQVGIENPLRALGMTPADLTGLNGPAVAFRDGRFVPA